MNLPQFILASASPARQKLLEMAGIKVITIHSNFDESLIQLDDPLDLVQTLAQKKAETVLSQFTNSLILGCDSVLALDGEIYGKPQSPQEAIARWHKMKGNTGYLYTGHALIDQTQNQQVIRCGITKVYFAHLSDRQIEEYVNSGEPLACAGCFAIDGKGGLFIEKLEGCHSNVIGLSLPLLRQMLTHLNYHISDFWENQS
jgi:septum formation protein